MPDFLAALGLFFAIEGICLAAFPLAAKRAMANILATPDGALRIAGVIFGGHRRCDRMAGSRMKAQSLFCPNPPSYDGIDHFYRCAPRVAGAFMFKSRL